MTRFKGDARALGPTSQSWRNYPTEVARLFRWEGGFSAHRAAPRPHAAQPGDLPGRNSTGGTELRGGRAPGPSKAFLAAFRSWLSTMTERLGGKEKDGEGEKRSSGIGQ